MPGWSNRLPHGCQAESIPAASSSGSAGPRVAVAGATSTHRLELTMAIKEGILTMEMNSRVHIFIYLDCLKYYHNLSHISIHLLLLKFKVHIHYGHLCSLLEPNFVPSMRSEAHLDEVCKPEITASCLEELGRHLCPVNPSEVSPMGCHSEHREGSATVPQATRTGESASSRAGVRGPSCTAMVVPACLGVGMRGVCGAANKHEPSSTRSSAKEIGALLWQQTETWTVLEI